MKVCVIQRNGIRHFHRFTNLAERDKLEIELQIEGSGKTIQIDLTQVLLDEYTKHPEIGKIIPASDIESIATHTRKPIKIKQSITAQPVYLTESKKEKDAMLAKVREAQYKAAEERKQKLAEINAAKAERLVAARKIKAEKEEAEKKKATAKAKTIAKANKTTKVKPSPKPEPAKLTKTQKSAIEKISKIVAKEEKTKVKATVQQAKSKAPVTEAITTKKAKPVKSEIPKKPAATTAKAKTTVKPETTIKPKVAAPKPIADSKSKAAVKSSTPTKTTAAAKTKVAAAAK